MIYLLFAVLLFTSITMLSAAASRKMDSNIFTLIVNIASVLLPAIIVAPYFGKKIVESNKSAIIMAVIAGLCVGAFAMTVNKSFTVNKVAIVTPVVFGGTILLTTILSYFIFKETIKGYEIVGLLLVLLGISFIVYARAWA